MTNNQSRGPIGETPSRPLTSRRTAALLIALAILVIVVVAAISTPRRHRGGPTKPTTPAPSPSLPGSSEPVVARTITVGGQALKEDYRTFGELASSPTVTLIVAGQVVEAEPEYREGLAATRLVVSVDRSSDPNLRAGMPVVIYRDGGRIPLAQVDPGAEVDPDAVVDFRFEGAANSVQGDWIVAFLHPDRNSGHHGGYQPVSSVHGLALLDAQTGRYQRLGDLPEGFERGVDEAIAQLFTAPRRATR